MAVADEAAELRQRVDRGELTLDRVRLASQLGSRAAADVLGGQALPRIKLPPRGPFEPTFAGGVEGACRCYAAMVWYTFTHSESANPRLHRSLQRSVLDFEEQVFTALDPSRIRLRLERKTFALLEPKQVDEDELEFADPLLSVLRLLVAIQASLARRPEAEREALWKAAWDAFFYGVTHKLNEVLRAEVLPWALGRSDPFRERYRARGEGG